MEDRRLLRLVYTFFLGILIALFVGVGINTFYPGPKQPQYPTALNTLGKEPTEQEIKIQQQWDKQMAAHEKELKPYNRNVSMIALGAAVLLLVVSVVLEKRIHILSEGTLVGGLFTLLYSIGRGFASQESKLVFAAVTIGLIIVLFVGYHQFRRQKKSIEVRHIE